jgi:hypothetical protein
VGASDLPASIDSISAPTVTTPTPDVITLSYENASLKVNLSYTLTGGSAFTGFSDISISIAVYNKSTARVDIHLFHYSDFDLGGTAAGDFAQYMGNAKINQWKTNEAGLSLAETVASRVLNHYESAVSPGLKNNLNSTPGYTLADTPAIGATNGPGDLQHAFQWDLAVAAQGSVVWSLDMTVSMTVPPHLQVVPTNDFASAGAPGGPFTPGSITYTLTNTTANPLEWSASQNVNWLSLSASNGTLPARGWTNVIVSVSSNATSLAAGHQPGRECDQRCGAGDGEPGHLGNRIRPAGKRGCLFAGTAGGWEDLGGRYFYQPVRAGA